MGVRLDELAIPSDDSWTDSELARPPANRLSARKCIQLANGKLGEIGGSNGNSKRARDLIIIVTIMH